MKKQRTSKEKHVCKIYLPRRCGEITSRISTLFPIENALNFYTFSREKTYPFAAYSGEFNKNNKLDKITKICYTYFAWTGKDILLGGKVSFVWQTSHAKWSLTTATACVEDSR